MVPYQRIELFETLGDANKGMSQLKKARDYYQEGLLIAEKNQISPKEIDLSSKIDLPRLSLFQVYYRVSTSQRKAIATSGDSDGSSTVLHFRGLAIFLISF